MNFATSGIAFCTIFSQTKQILFYIITDVSDALSDGWTWAVSGLAASMTCVWRTSECGSSPFRKYNIVTCHFEFL